MMANANPRFDLDRTPEALADPTRCAGREHLLSLSPEPVGEAGAWIERQRSLWSARLNALDEPLRSEDRAAGDAAGADRDRKGALL